MKKLSFLVLSIFIFTACNNEEVDSHANTSVNNKTLTVQEVNQYISDQLSQTGDVDWTHAPANILYSAIMHGDGILSLGYGQPGEHFAQVKTPDLIAAKQNAISIATSTEGINKTEDLLIADDETLNSIELKINNLETVVALQAANQVRYIDPIGYGLYVDPNTIALKSSSGCDQGGQDINSNDYTVVTPNAWKPWNYDLHNIDDAWNYSTGAGVTVGLIDTGISANQNLLGSDFNDGDSSGRSIEKFGTFVDSNWWWSDNTDGPNDLCGHGTTMASTIASPRNNDAMPVGVAYNSNMVAYRGTEDVLINDYHERKGVSNALKALGDRSDVKIISMSIGYLWTVGNIEDAVKYAYSRNKMIVAAGGTSTSFTSWYGVIFPASMSETVAVTGLKDNGYNRCNICHEGDQIDFTIIMQRASDESRTVPTLGFNNGTRKYVGGSSVATATTAGIAALIWSKNPSWSREQVLNKMKQSSEFYPNRNSKFGYGNIDALKTVE
ncbi:S8 family serine peptidase [uncultured Nonlabens sp.]|uniref:S8 family serine peptidase n=1 Tax=uncultured Nonlabens sp. TaxID=859306 RepID=UPI0026030857|nr:S8 family serine peptidase [uncultured Nonlabens sp.]